MNFYQPKETHLLRKREHNYMSAARIKGTLKEFARFEQETTGNKCRFEQFQHKGTLVNKGPFMRTGLTLSCKDRNGCFRLEGIFRQLQPAHKLRRIAVLRQQSAFQGFLSGIFWIYWLRKGLQDGTAIELGRVRSMSKHGMSVAEYYLTYVVQFVH